MRFGTATNKNAAVVARHFSGSIAD